LQWESRDLPFTGLWRHGSNGTQTWLEVCLHLCTVNVPEAERVLLNNLKLAKWDCHLITISWNNLLVKKQKTRLEIITIISVSHFITRCGITHRHKYSFKLSVFYFSTLFFLFFFPLKYKSTSNKAKYFWTTSQWSESNLSNYISSILSQRLNWLPQMSYYNSRETLPKNCWLNT